MAAIAVGSNPRPRMHSVATLSSLLSGAFALFLIVSFPGIGHLDALAVSGNRFPLSDQLQQDPRSSWSGNRTVSIGPRGGNGTVPASAWRNGPAPSFRVESGEFRSDGAASASEQAGWLYILLLLAVVGAAFLFLPLRWLRRRMRQLRQCRARPDEESAAGARAGADGDAYTVERTASAGWYLLGNGSERQRIFVEIPKALVVASARGVLLGRSSRKADIVIKDPAVSRLHARLFVMDGALYIEDLGSTNGTWVDHEPIGRKSPRALRVPALIEFGAVRLQFEFRAERKDTKGVHGR